MRQPRRNPVEVRLEMTEFRSDFDGVARTSVTLRLFLTDPPALPALAGIIIIVTAVVVVVSSHALDAAGFYPSSASLGARQTAAAAAATNAAAAAQPRRSRREFVELRRIPVDFDGAARTSPRPAQRRQGRARGHACVTRGRRRRLGRPGGGYANPVEVGRSSSNFDRIPLDFDGVARTSPRPAQRRQGRAHGHVCVTRRRMCPRTQYVNSVTGRIVHTRTSRAQRQRYRIAAAATCPAHRAPAARGPNILAS